MRGIGGGSEGLENPTRDYEFVIGEFQGRGLPPYTPRQTTHKILHSRKLIRRAVHHGPNDNC